MDRLTYWNEEYGCWSYTCPSGDAAKHLAEYEDTGLTPAEVAELAQANKQLKELLQLAVGDMSIGWLCAVCSKRTKGKEWAMCQYQAFASVFDEERTVTCANFEWQHTDKLKGLIEL